MLKTFFRNAFLYVACLSTLGCVTVSHKGELGAPIDPSGIRISRDVTIHISPTIGSDAIFEDADILNAYGKYEPVHGEGYTSTFCYESFYDRNYGSIYEKNQIAISAFSEHLDIIPSLSYTQDERNADYVLGLKINCDASEAVKRSLTGVAILMLYGVPTLGMGPVTGINSYTGNASLYRGKPIPENLVWSSNHRITTRFTGSMLLQMDDQKSKKRHRETLSELAKALVQKMINEGALDDY